VTKYILGNIARYAIIILNSERDWKDNSSAATNPTSLFTIIIGGNIVSRGVTLDNLLSMFFTRDVQHKIQQDTYIQRARMFGSRVDYLRFFELTIPQSLYNDWHRCFVFHRLALDAIREGHGSLVWLGDHRISAVATSSIDRSTVDLDRGEMSFKLFDYNPEIEAILALNIVAIEKMVKLAAILGNGAFPEYLRRYINRSSPKASDSIIIHTSTDVSLWKESDGFDKKNIIRQKGFIGQTSRYPNALHHLMIVHNGSGKARLVYKFIGSIQFIKNTSHDC
jgi:Z1 domain